MRSLLLILKILVTTSLFIHPMDSLASKSKISKGKKVLQKNTVKSPSNIWDIVRLSQLPRYYSTPVLVSPATSLPSADKTESDSTKKLLAQTTTLTTSHHDDTNRPRLHTVIGDTNNRDKLKTKTNLSQAELKKEIDSYVNAQLTETPKSQTRLRTRIELRPKIEIEQPSAAISKPESIIIKTTTISNGIEGKVKTETKLAKTGTEKAVPQVKQLSSSDERVGKHVNWYASHSDYLQRVAERSRPYLYHIVSELKAHGLPAELALLPIVESAYQPTAQSPKSAAGLWQFIPSTGLDFDLAQTEHYDARLDITASTKAAVRYLAMLKRHFNGDWLLALAAYNCGQGRVDDAVSSNRANGLPTDYWSLHLPEETQEYVPRFLALSNIFANPKAYNVKLPVIKNEPYFVKVKVDRQFDIGYLASKQLSTIAELAKLSHEQFMQLNPGYIKPTPATDRPFTLLLPADNAKQLNQHLNYVARFIAEPELLASNNSILHKKPDIKPESPKQLATVAVTSLVHKPTHITSPLLSLTISPNQTTPRVPQQPLITDIHALIMG